MARLYRKWKVFVEEYLRLGWNGTQAYKAVYGQQLSDNVAQVSASKLLSKSMVKDYLDQRISERAMGANEVIDRLGEHARVDIGMFYDPATNTVDMRKAKQAGATRLIKKIKQTVRTKDDEETIYTEVELVDGQAALQLLGRHHKLFTDVTENTTKINIQGKEALLDRVYGDSNDPTS